MKKIAFAFAALFTLGIATPTIASAETVVIKKSAHRHHHMDRGWHHGGHGHKTVVIKEKHRNY